MASINFGPFGENWFKKPPNPFAPLNLLSLTQSLNISKPSKSSSFFASISNSNTSSNGPKDEPEKLGVYRQMLEQFYMECEELPDLRHAPEVDKILEEQDSIFEKKENPTKEEVEENEKWWNDFRSNPVIKFLERAEYITDKINEMELKENEKPYRREDAKLWKDLPHVIGLDGRPMPRKAIKTRKESNDKFWDFTKQFFFGLWGFRQRPYPPGRPIDVTQAIGYKRLENRYYDFAMKPGSWFYKDRIGRTRGPMELIQLKTAFGAGIIDEHTFVWGEDMDEWAPIGMIYGLDRAIITWEVKLAAKATAFLHKLQKGIPPWVPLKGQEKKTYKQMQDEAIESKRRDLAVLDANDGYWPGVRTPSHALFLWASGTELTSVLEADHMPNKYIPKHLRQELIKMIPGLRPWEVLSVEQAMDQLTYGGQWFREPLGTFTTGPPYIEEWNADVMALFNIYYDLSVKVYNHLEKRIPGFNVVMDKVNADTEARNARRRRRREKDQAWRAGGKNDDDNE
ncbi:protein TIC 56, chloroplastic [Impatiens glandulifera]|uniref:protein TIC 56, chloroplastic n=1 Tax=Impatiens glandulifera TaxID=253017 RepID=UPI001FB17D44|nr:protein TIC 56, chloroplastic [Impatiens glandulifera]